MKCGKICNTRAKIQRADWILGEQRALVTGVRDGTQAVGAVVFTVS